MIDGLTKKEAKRQLAFDQQELKNEAEYLKTLTKTARGSFSKLSKAMDDLPDAGRTIKRLQDDLTAGLKSYSEFQKQQQILIEKLRKQNASEEQILAIRKKTKELEEERKSERDNALKKCLVELEKLTEQGNLTSKNNDIAARQLAVLEKTFKIDEAYYKKRLQLDRGLDDSLRDLKKSYAEQAESRRADHKKNIIKALPFMLGPLRAITDPILTLVKGGNTQTVLGGALERASEKRRIKKDYKKSVRELEAEARFDDDLAKLEKKAGFSKIGKKGESLSYSSNDSSYSEGMASFLANDSHNELSIPNDNNTSLMDKISPDEGVLLAKGGVIGAGFVFLARQMGVGQVKGKKSPGESGGIGVPGKLLKSVFKSGAWKAAVPVLAIAGGAAMVGAAARMQRRDSADARQYEGARAAETWLLGDRSRTTEDNYTSELGRTTGKASLAIGGVGLGAAGVAGTGAMVGAVKGAGGLAALGGGGKLAGLAAAGKVGLAAMGPVGWAALGVAAVGAGVVATVKGTQQAFELEWDKNQAQIQKELHDVMYSDDASLGEKIKAGGASLWKGFTGTLAGGIRDASEIMSVSAQEHKERQLSFLEEQAEAGSEHHANLLQVMQSEEFEGMSKKDRKQHLKKLGLYDTYRSSRSVTRDRTAGLRAVGGFFRGALNTYEEGLRGKSTARWQRDILRGKSFSSDEEKEAYIAEMREKGIADGTLREDGMVAKAPRSRIPAMRIAMLAKRAADDLKSEDSEIKAGFGKLRSGAGLLFESMRGLVDEFVEDPRKTTEKMLNKGLSKVRGGVLNFFESVEGNVTELRKDPGGFFKSKVNRLKEGIGAFLANPGGTIANIASGAWNTVTGWFSGGGSSSPAPTDTADDAVISKDGKLIKLSDDDNIYATKNSFNVLDQGSQAAMPSITRPAKEFSDAGIIHAIQVLTEVLRSKEISPVVIPSETSVNFDQYRTVGNLI